MEGALLVRTHQHSSKSSETEVGVVALQEVVNPINYQEPSLANFNSLAELKHHFGGFIMSTPLTSLCHFLTQRPCQVEINLLGRNHLANLAKPLQLGSPAC